MKGIEHNTSDVILDDIVNIESKSIGKNPNILKQMRKAGIERVSELCRQMGIPQSQAIIGQLINMKIPVYTEDGGWNKYAVELAKFFGLLPEDLFEDNEQRWGPDGKPDWYITSTTELQKNADAPSTEDNPAAYVEKLFLKKEMGQAINKLNDQQQAVIKMRFGIDSDKEPMTLQEIAGIMKLSTERIRHIEEAAMMKLRRSAERMGLIEIKKPKHSNN